MAVIPISLILIRLCLCQNIDIYRQSPGSLVNQNKISINTHSYQENVSIVKSYSCSGMITFLPKYDSLTVVILSDRTQCDKSCFILYSSVGWGLSRFQVYKQKKQVELQLGLTPNIFFFLCFLLKWCPKSLSPMKLHELW